MRGASQSRLVAVGHLVLVCTVDGSAVPDTLLFGPGRAGLRYCDRGLPRNPATSGRPPRARRPS